MRIRQTKLIGLAGAIAAATAFTAMGAAKQGGDANATNKAPAATFNLEQASARVDELVEANYKRHNVQPNVRIDDETFLRRAYLSIIGRIPTYDEAIAFLVSKDENRRKQLVDHLMSGEGYVSHQFNWWADILRLKSRVNNNINGQPYIEWVKDAIRTNMPYDVFVRSQLTASGHVTDNPAAGYYLRDAGMPLDNMANTSRIFLGTQIGCAQCHDHPFDVWTQREFYELAAYTFGVDTRTRPEGFNELQRLAREQKLTAQERQMLQRLLRPALYGVTDNPRRQLRLPDDYKYDDAKPKSLVTPHTLFGDAGAVSRGDNPREVFADWLTSADNPRFTKVIANRLWKRVMGVGLIEPVDEIVEGTAASNPELLDYLEQQMRALNYDMKQFMRMLYHTKTFERAAGRYEPREDTPYHAQGPYLRRMTAEQMWDSLLTLMRPQIDTRTGNTAVAGYAGLDVRKYEPQEVIDMAKQAAAKPDGLRDVLRKEMVDEMRQNRPRGGSPNEVRASELPQPARPGHLLNEFGQSDREMIENANASPTVTQVLQMVNGQMYRQLMSKDSLLRQNLETAGDTDARIEVLFVSILSRRPTQTDMVIARRAIKDDEQKGYEDLIWALLNTREFMFVQ